MFSRLLIANRGEIAMRIVRACVSLGIRSVAIHTDDDADSLHVRAADESVRIAGGVGAYRDAEAIVAVAVSHGVEAIHPGYGFLSEDADFAVRVHEAGLCWIGPDPEALTLFSDKRAAREFVAGVGVPVVPGIALDSGRRGIEQAVDFGVRHGWPIILKAVAGGGGRGIRVVESAELCAEALAATGREGARFFGDDRMIAEKYMPHGKHVEVQIIGDRHGTIQVIGDRDCSVQRRRQKLIEEAPAAGLDPTVRIALHRAARAIGVAVKYVGAGTVEFLVDGTEFWFLEVNPRIQVEHPVSEEVFGRDLVAEQIRIAAGWALDQVADPPAHGHAIEVRINAEDPDAGFRPATGRLQRFQLPSGSGIRIETGFEEGDDVTPHFDSLMAKVIVHAEDRTAAIAAMSNALSAVVIRGVPSTAEFLAEAIGHEDFESGSVTVNWLEGAAEKLLARMGSAQREDVVVIGGREVQLAMVRMPSETGRSRRATGRNSRMRGGTGSSDEVRSPMIGVVVGVHVAPGARVARGEPLLTVEAMKLENIIRADSERVVEAVEVVLGEQVVSDQLLVSYSAV